MVIIIRKHVNIYGNITKMSQMPFYQVLNHSDLNKITVSTLADGNAKNFEIAVPLKCLSNFLRTLEMPLMNREINVILTWSSFCIISNLTNAGTFVVTDTKLYFPVINLSTQDSAKLLKSGFKRTINSNKYQSKVTLQAQNPYLDYLVDPSFQGVNRFFVLSFKDK